MKKSIAMKWVKALRSGKYKQTKGVLKNDIGYCCLGVLCDISNVTDWQSSISYKTTYYYDGCEESLPSSVMRWSGMQSDIGYTAFKNKGDLAKLNDVKKWGFKRIATFIEKNWKKL